MLLDINKNSDNAFVMDANWMGNHSTISFLGLWKQIFKIIPILSSSKS